MKHQFTKFSELWSALFDGHKLKCEGHTGSYYLFDGDMHLETHGHNRLVKGFNFKYPTLWSIVEEPEWDDNIPEEGTACIVSWEMHEDRTLCDTPSNNWVAKQDTIVGKTTEGSYVGATGSHWGYATPVNV